MPRKRYKPEEIVAKLRQVDVLTSQGQSAADAIRSIGVEYLDLIRRGARRGIDQRLEALLVRLIT